MNISRKVVHIILILVIIAIVAIVVAVSIQRYEIEGEKNMPFEISKIMIISTAEGFANENSEYKWDFNIFQNNDIFISIAKNKNYKKKEVIDKISLTNFSIDKQPLKGQIVFYKPNNESKTVYTCSEEFEFKDKLEYTGSKETDMKNLTIGNQGGMAVFRVSNKNLHRYQSNDDETIKHDGTLIQKANILNDEIKCKISFDIIIELQSGKKYKGRISLDLPIGDIVTNGQESMEITDLDNVVFKRV